MLEHLNRYFTAAHRFRRSERSLVRAGARMELEDLRPVAHPKIQAKIDALLRGAAVQQKVG